MTKSLVFWEYGKYAIILILAIGASRYFFSNLLPWLYIACLIPSVLLILGDAGADFTMFRKELSYNFSGPLALAITYAALGRFRVSGEEYRKAILAFCYSLSGAAFLCFFGLYSRGSSMSFGTESNFAASGGFGPNQVSAVLGAGALMVFLFCLDPGRQKNVRNLMVVLGLWFAAQSALTFSRAGIAYTVASIVAGSLFFIQNAKIRNRFIAFVLVAWILGGFVILPKLDRYTGGNLSARFNEQTTTGRSDIMKEELEIFKKNPIMGIGIGQAKLQRTYKAGAASHTEFTRLLAEHGSFGVLAMFFMLLMIFAAFMRAKTKKGRAFVVALSSWALFFMVGNGMRLVTPSFIFGLSAIVILPDIRRPMQSKASVPVDPSTLPNEKT